MLMLTSFSAFLLEARREVGELSELLDNIDIHEWDVLPVILLKMRQGFKGSSEQELSIFYELFFINRLFFINFCLHAGTGCGKSNSAKIPNTTIPPNSGNRFLPPCEGGEK